MLPPRPLLATSLLLLGGLAWSVSGSSPPDVPIAQATLWEGQSVTMQGIVHELRPQTDGTIRFILQDGTWAIPVRVGGDFVATEGDHVAASGRLARAGGSLLLAVEDSKAVGLLPAMPAEQASWATLASDPGAWDGRVVRLVGTIDAGRFGEGGTTVALGSGPWPRSGAVEATGALRYDAACLCHRLDAREVRPWTP